MWRSSSAALAASRSAIRRLISAAEKVPAPAGCVALRFSDICSFPNSASHQRPSMAGNHQILVGLYNICCNAAARRADALLVLPVGRLVQIQPEPATGAADRAPHRYRILPDPSGEHDAVE